MKLSTVAAVAGVAALGYVAWRWMGGKEEAVAEPAAPKDPLLLPAPTSDEPKE